jgi:hypothetical protein
MAVPIDCTNVVLYGGVVDIENKLPEEDPSTIYKVLF